KALRRAVEQRTVSHGHDPTAEPLRLDGGAVDALLVLMRDLDLELDDGLEHLDAAVEAGVAVGDVVSHLADLVLARACAAGDSRAVRGLEDRFGVMLETIATKLRSLPVAPAEFRRDMLRHILEPRPSRGPRIDSYRGRGTL